jgi:hypothetical protein
LVVVVIFLFVGIGIQPAIANVELKKDIIDVETKNYLFQTIIDIVNNPDVKKLFKQYNNDLIKVDIDRGFYFEVLFRNPRTLHSMIFSKQSLTFEYLDKCYNKGSEITKIIGEDKVIEMIESIRISKPTVFYKLSNIITRNKDLSIRISTLQALNKDSLICDFLMLIGYPIGSLYTLMNIFIKRNEENPIRYLFFRIIGIPINVMMVSMVLLLNYLHCLEFPP